MPPGLLELIGSLIGLGPLLFGGRGEQAGLTLPPQFEAMLNQALATEGRREALVDPANFANLGLSEMPAEGVPLRAAANQLAFALLPNFVRPSNSLFPGVAPPFGPAAGFLFPPSASGPERSPSSDDRSFEENLPLIDSPFDDKNFVSQFSSRNKDFLRRKKEFEETFGVELEFDPDTFLKERLQPRVPFQRD